MADTVWDLSWLPLAVVIVTMLVGGFVRGFGGFGASMVWVIGMSTVLPPASAIPTALILEVLASLQLLPRAWREAHWASLKWLMLGVLVGLPVGTWVLISVPERPMRLVIGVVVLATTLVMASGRHRENLPGAAGATGTGVVSGVLNGALAMGGPPAIIMYFSSPRHAAMGRASLIVFFLFTDVLGTGSAAVGGLVTPALLGQSAVLFPVSLIGVGLGALWYRRTGAEDFHGYVLWLLAGLSGLILAQTILA
ncbi:MAG TPA: sulfite exporter TauE/SafE family protein [Candidatus Nesterenkonia stercoripullorum]|uniref:Probable membrane transporter protein n=1 Tax=Candidatus Nesterenkonia stercoripullorum TaxID=2838701 RepID=A0A9D1UU28_9MICC|nr:sulfite exporter TauE/SafE family protein [Candidatus Nesterenkonia stercoripullorum]